MDGETVRVVTRAEVRKQLLVFFWLGDIERWLSKYPDNHEFKSDTFTGEFIDYLSTLG
jgi:hypothetical protein